MHKYNYLLPGDPGLDEKKNWRVWSRAAPEPANRGGVSGDLVRSFLTPMRSAVYELMLACLMGAAACFTPSSFRTGFRMAPSKSRHLLRAPAQTPMLERSGCCRPKLRASASGDGSSSRGIAGTYWLVKDPEDVHRDLERDPYRVQQIKLGAHATRMCTEILEDRTAEGTAYALRNLSGMAVAVELISRAVDRRTFVLPGDVTVHVRERSYSKSGLGGSLWGSGIGLSILLGNNSRKFAPYR